MSDVQIVAVWGSPNSGKTTTCMKMARRLAKQGKDVLIILDDPFCPNLPVLTIPKKDCHSLGERMGAQKITQNDILTCCVPVKGSQRICLLGYVLGDHLYKYTNYNSARAEELLILCRHMVDVVLVDCDSRISKSALSAAALEMADKVIRLVECTRKSISAQESAKTLLEEKEHKYNVSSHVWCYSNVKPWQDSASYQTRMQSKHVLPHCPELEKQLETVQMLKGLSGKAGAKYEKALQLLIQEVFELCPSKNKVTPIHSQETPASS